MKWTPVLALLIGCAATAPAPGEPACQSCHGTEASAAPPKALGGFTEVSSRGVGAHTAHLQGTRLGVPIACEECHVTVTSVGQEGHIDDAWPADLKWGDLGKTDGATITWNEDLSCSGSYCHGATLSGGTLTEPVWTDTDASITTCGACHGNPPPAPHPSEGGCGNCHESAQGGLNPDLHIDGILQVDNVGPGSCDDCHGADGDPSPPPALNGATAPSDPGVGAHQTHLGLTLSTAIPCSDCHAVPTATDDPGHLNGTTEVDQLGVAASSGVSPSYDHATQTCTNYCHDPDAGGSSTAPVWTGGALGCDSCHGAPPPAPHPADAACENCHPNAAAGPVITDPSTHVDGTVQIAQAQACDTCHGANGNPNPPPALNGATATTDPGVGAHQVHLAPASTTALACGDCHTVPAAVSDAGHNNGTTEVTLQGRAASGGVTPSYTPAGQTCTAYCHDPGLNGATPIPTWTGTLGACGDCHSLPPPAPHPASASCSNCHSNAAPGPSIADPSTHIDGLITF